MKNKGFKNVLAMCKEQIRDAELVSRVQTLDKVTITLGEMGMSPEWIKDFRDKYIDVEQEFSRLVLDDAKDDKQIVYATDKIDRIIKQYVPEDMFVPYEERYGL